MSVSAKIPPERDRIERLKRHISRREYTVAVIGLGYVGLPLAARFGQTTETVAATLRVGQLVCLESTTYPGTTEEVVLPRLARTGLTVGRDFFLAYSPEREDPGNLRYSTATIPKLVGGVTAEPASAGSCTRRPRRSTATGRSCLSAKTRRPRRCLPTRC